MSEEVKSSKKIQEFFIKTLNGMAHGLFATLIIGTIFATIGIFFSYGKGNAFCDFMFKVIGDGKPANLGLSFCLQALTGAGIGVGIALALKFDILKTISLAAVGELAAFFSLSCSKDFPTTLFIESNTFKIGDPLTIYVVVILTALLIKLILKKKTPVDILIIPLFSVFVGTALSLGVRYPLIFVTSGLQWVINNATTVVPALMGIIISVLMGMALTAPISSAAIAAMVFSVNPGDPISQGLAIASGAAIVGCCTQMIGFAIQSRKDNSLGMIFSIGIGTSMLQFKNIIKKPIIWLPTIITSAILGPIATCTLQTVCMGSSAGMGTAGLIGLIGTFSSMGNTWQTWVSIFVLELLAPAILVFVIDLIFRKVGWIKPGDLRV